MGRCGQDPDDKRGRPGWEDDKRLTSRSVFLGAGNPGPQGQGVDKESCYLQGLERGWGATENYHRM